MRPEMLFEFDFHLSFRYSSKLQIFYASRTHSQLSQFVSELARTSHASDTKLVSLGSRRSLCIHKEVQKLTSIERINEACLDMIKGNEKSLILSKFDGITNLCLLLSDNSLCRILIVQPWICDSGRQSKKSSKGCEHLNDNLDNFSEIIKVRIHV